MELYLGRKIEGEFCPNGHQIYYNGNAFCSEFDETGCWALPHPPELTDSFSIEFHNRHGGFECCPEFLRDNCTCHGLSNIDCPIHGV